MKNGLSLGEMFYKDMFDKDASTKDLAAVIEAFCKDKPELRRQLLETLAGKLGDDPCGIAILNIIRNTESSVGGRSTSDAAKFLENAHFGFDQQ